MSAVLRFDLAESLRSKWFIFLVALFGAGAALGTYIFLGIFEGFEHAARQTLSESMGAPVDSLPANLVREKALPMVAELIQDPGIRTTLLAMEPYCVFFGFISMGSVAVIALMAATQSVASDVSTGAARYVLIRCGRMEWALGKTAGQLALLLCALVIGAVLSALVGSASGQQGLRALPWLLRAGLSAWLYGAAFVGLFFGVALACRSAGLSRLVSLVLWIGITVVPWLLNFAAVGGPALWVFPSTHKHGLWSSDPGTYAFAALSLLLIGGLGFLGGFTVFSRRDV